MSKRDTKYKSEQKKTKEAVEALKQMGVKPTQNQHRSKFIPYSKKGSPIKQPPETARSIK